MMHGKDMLKILEEDIRFWREDMYVHEKVAILRPELIFYDYPSMMIPEKRKPLVNADQLIGWERK